MDQPLGVLGTPNVGLFSLIIIGGFAGWIAGMVLGIRRGIFANILIGIIGSFVGSKLAETFHVAVFGSISHFIAALVGSIIVIYLWSLIRQQRQGNF
jgi:uncharacterized membrane protein YeaQ/YmgE (transglycosylase-associated protein family)